MNLEKKDISGSIIKKIRRDLSLRQKDLKCEGLSNISRIENRETPISYTVAKRLCSKINQIMLERNITLDYDVTVDLLMGKTSVFRRDLLDRLEYYEDENMIFEEINQVIANLDSDQAIEFTIKVLDVLNKNIYKHNEKICHYCYRMLSCNLTTCTKIDIFNYLIRSYFIQEQYATIVGIGESFTNEVHNHATNKQKEKFFGNIANTYFCINEYEKCEDCLNLISSFQELESELFFLSLKAKCRSELNDKIEAIKIYESIIDKSIKISNLNYIANSYSNMGDLYLKDDLDVARKYIDKSIELTSNCTIKKFILNCYHNKFLLSIKEKNIENIKHNLDYSIRLAKDINDLTIGNKLVVETLNYCIDNGLDDDIIKFILLLKDKYNYRIEHSTLFACIGKINNEKLAYKIIKIAQKQ